MSDLEIRAFRERLIQTINESDLPLEVKRLVLKEVYSEVANKTDELISIQKQREVQNEQSVQ